MRRFFNPESLLWRIFGHIGDAVILSLLWTACCIPVVTMGGATAALYDTVVHGFRRGDTDTLGRFFRTFRREWKGAIPSTVLWLAVIGGGAALYRRFLASAPAGDRSVVIAVAMVTVLALVVGTGCWVFPLLSRFTFTFPGLNLAALRLGIGRLPVTAVLVVSLWGALWLTVRWLFFPVMILPALLMLLWSVVLEPVFRALESSRTGPPEEG